MNTAEPASEAAAQAYAPSPEFAAAAHVRSMAEYEALWRRSIDHPAEYWAEEAQAFDWFSPWSQVLDWNPPDARWFVDATTNVSVNCLDRHVASGRGDHAALIWEAESGEVRRFSFGELTREVCRFANALRALGVQKGERVTIYMPMIPELPIAMLACARIGAPHSVIFGGFSPQAIADRVQDAQSRIILTADVGYRRGKPVPFKAHVDEACARLPAVDRVVVCRRGDGDVPMQAGRDHWWHELVADVADTCPPEPLDVEHMLFLLYTSGTTGKPKGIVHTTGGYMVHAGVSARYVFDLKPDDVYWCTADIGWITGHSYLVYGILANGVTTLLYEGAPNYPEWDRFWAIIARHKVTKFYTTPTVIRAAMRQNGTHVQRHDLSSLRLLGSVGEAISAETWRWFREHIGQGRCPVVDTWWQTETGGIMIAPLPGATATPPGCVTRPFFGVDAVIVNTIGDVQPQGSQGLLAIRQPWPGMLRGLYGDRERYVQQYWTMAPGLYLAGDAARVDAQGNFWILGRVDDVIKVSGHRLGTGEVESALVAHPAVAEAAVVAVQHDVKGQAMVAFVMLREGHQPSQDLAEELLQHVSRTVSPIARPERVRFAATVPKTRSGKIMRGALKDLAASAAHGDITTAEDLAGAAERARAKST
jgi:acetyl-CoA synthetase